MRKLPLLLAISILAIVFTVGCGKQVFNGNRSSNDKQFIMDYTILNRTETHEMELKKGSKVDVVIDNKSGRLDIVVANNDGKEIYRGDDAQSGKFTLDIQESGTYKFTVTGKKAKGGFSFKVNETN